MTIKTANLASQLETRIASLERAASMYDGVILGQGFIVALNGFGLDLTLEGRLVTGGKPCPVEKATLLTRHDAETVAATTRDGRGVAAQAMHVTDAIAASIASARELLAIVNA